MALIPWEPFRDFDRIFDDDFDFLPVVPMRGTRSPEVDVYQTEKDVVVEMPLAGVRPEDVEISVEENILVASGKTEEKKEEKKKNYFRKEIRKGSFERSVALPVEVRGEKAEAESENGMLKVIIPKTDKKKQNKVKVKVKAKGKNKK